MAAPRYDVDRYSSLVNRATFNGEFWRGAIQDQSRNRLAMATTDKMVKFGSHQVVRRVNSSAAVPSVINSTQPFWVEVMAASGPDYLLYQINAGGWTVYYPIDVQLVTYTAAIGTARRITAALGTLWPNGTMAHVVGYLDPVGLTGQWWFKGIPITTVFTNTAPPVVCGNATLIAGTVLGTNSRVAIARIWQDGIAPTNEDAACLYAASQNLVSG